jgi:competence protein ComEA
MLKKILAILAFLFASAAAFAAIDVNKATEAELDAIKGIGPGTSKMILDERKKGEFKSWEDFITRVKGVGDTRAGNLSEAGLRVGGKTYKPAAAEKKEAKAEAKADKKEAKAEAKADKKQAKAEATADKKEAKAEAKADKKEAKAEAKADKKEAKAEAKADKKEAAAKDAKPAASAAKK